MRELNYTGLIPVVGSVGIVGKNIEEPLVRALAYRVAEGDRVFLVPSNPRQFDLAEKLNIPTMQGFPDFLFLEADRELKDGFFSVGQCESPMLLRLLEQGADKTIVFLRHLYNTVSVEVTPVFLDTIEAIVSLYGEVVSRRTNHFGNVVLEIVPIEHDPEELRRLLREVPGVLEVGILPIVPYRKILLRRL